MLNDETTDRTQPTGTASAQAEQPDVDSLKAMGCKRPEEEVFVRPETLGLER